VHGLDGLDEITLANTTIVAEVSPDNVRTFQIAPEDFGLTRMPLNALRCDRPESSAHTIREVLSGKLRNGARDLVVMNAAAALLIGGKAESLIEGRRQAERSIDEGAAHTKLDQLIRLTNQ
jgi:anthranilate phosphoribosyltransferase